MRKLPKSGNATPVPMWPTAGDGDTAAMNALLHSRQFFGRRVACRRTELGLKAKDVAQDAGIDATYLSRIEHGRAWPKRPVRVALAHTLDVELANLEGPEDQIA